MAWDSADFNGNFKEQYGEFQNLIPDEAMISKEIGFSEGERLGENYRFPVYVRRSQGFTFAGPATTGTVYALSAVRSGRTEDATVVSTETALREQFATKPFFAAQTTKQAFKNAFDLIIMGMIDSMYHMSELELLYGQDTSGIGVVSAITAAGAGTETITITAATSAIGIWSSMEGAPLDVWSAAFAAKRTATAPLIVTNVDYDPAASTVKITVTGVIGELAVIAATDVIVPFGWVISAASFNVSVGLFQIAGNTGTLFNVDAAVFGLWKANTFAAGSAQLTMGKLLKAAALQVGRTTKKTLTVYLHPDTWTDLNQDQAALRQINKGKGKIVQGADSLEYHGTTGIIKVKAHSMMMAGRALLFDPNDIKNVGASDVTFTHPGSMQGPESKPRFFIELAGSMGYELRLWKDCAAISKAPAAMTEITGIVNS